MCFNNRLPDHQSHDIGVNLTLLFHLVLHYIAVSLNLSQTKPSTKISGVHPSDLDTDIIYT